MPGDGRAKTPEAEQARRAKISAAMQGNTGALKRGRYSQQLQEVGPVRCGETCPLGGKCPGYAQGTVCSLRPELLSLAQRAVELTGNDAYYDHRTLAGLLASIVQVSTLRLVRGVADETDEGLGLDPEVTRLSQAVVGQLQKLARLLGYDKRDPLVVVDQRRQSVQVRVNDLPEEDFTRALKALAELRQVGQHQLAERLLSGDASALDALEVES